MLRGLLIRQLFVLVELVLAVAIVGVAYVVIARVFEEEAQVLSPNLDPDAPPAPQLFRPPQPREAYAAIVESDLYGTAARARAEGAATAAEGDAVEVETTLPLRLYGALAAYPTDPLGTAVIEDATTSTTNTYYLNQVVYNGYALVEIHKRRVILKSPGDPTLHVLRAEETVQAATAKPLQVARARPSTRAGPTRREPPKQVIVKRDEIVKELGGNFLEMYKTVKPRAEVDQNGSVIGITSDTISQVPLAGKFGFKDGDVVQMINGVTIDSEQRVYEVVERFQSAPTHWVSILRDGKPQTLVFKVE